MPGDVAHDIFGFAVDFVSELVVQFIKDKVLTISSINSKISKIPYAEIDKNNKPQILKERPLTQLRFKQTACEMRNVEFITFIYIVFRCSRKVMCAIIQ